MTAAQNRYIYMNTLAAINKSTLRERNIQNREKSKNFDMLMGQKDAVLDGLVSKNLHVMATKSQIRCFHTTSNIFNSLLGFPGRSGWCVLQSTEAETAAIKLHRQN